MSKVRYPIWYKKNGVRFIRDMLTPPMFNNTEVPLPIYSIVHYFRPYETINKDTEFLRFDKSISVVPIHNNIDPLHKRNIKKISSSTYIKSIAKQSDLLILTDTQYKLLKGKKNHTSTLKGMVCYDYGYIRAHYRDVGIDRFRLYNDIQNEIYTLHENIKITRKTFKDVDHKHFIVIDTPTSIVDVPKLFKFLKDDKLSEAFLHTFNTNSKLIYFELVKLLVGKSTIFDVSDIEMVNDIVLLLTYGDATVAIELRQLLSYSPAYTDITGDKLSEVRLLKLFNNIITLIDTLDPNEDVAIQLNRIGITVEQLESDSVDVVIDTTSKKMAATVAPMVVDDTDDVDRGEVVASPVDVVEEAGYSKPIKKKMMESAEALPELQTDLGTPAEAVKKINVKAETTKDLRGAYVEEMYHADLLKTTTALANSGVILTDLKMTVEKDILGDRNKIEMKYLDKGKVTNITMMTPVLKEDGVFKIAGVDYKIRSQKTDAPIKKINWNTVLLSSVYSKVNVVKARRSSQDVGKQVYKLLDESEDVEAIVGGTLSYNNDYTPMYGVFSRHIKLISYKGMKFEFGLEMKRGRVRLNDNYELIDDMVHSLKSKSFKPVNLYGFFGIAQSTLKREYPEIALYKEHIPLVWILIYFIGFKNLAKELKLDYKISKVKLKGYDIEVKFTDGFLYVNTGEVNYHIMNGLTAKKFIPKDESISILENKAATLSYFHECGLVNSLLTNLKVMEYGWMDPITKDVLTVMNMPTEFYKLLLKASELLVNDDYVNPLDMTEQMFRGDEKIAMLMYKALIVAVKEREANAWYGGAKIKVDPFEVMKQLNSDPAVVLMEDVSPIAYDKLVNETTMAGALGRDANSIMLKDRGVNASAMGYLSDSKDSSDAGVVSFLPAEPLLDNVRGVTKDNSKIKLKYSNILSTNNMLMPFITQDDGKRALTSNIMGSSVIPIDKPNLQAVRTGYEHEMIKRVPLKFGLAATEDGVVSKLTNTSITVTYKTSGEQTFSIKSYTGKETSRSTIQHILKPLVVEGQSFKKDDVLYYDTSCFMPDILNPNRVVYCNSANVNVLLLDTDGTYEDGVDVSAKVAGEVVTTKSVVVKDTLLKFDTDIDNIVTSGTVTYADILYSIDVSNIDNDDIKEYIENTVVKPMKAKVKGKVLKVECFYNGEYDNLPKAIQAITNKKHKVNAMYSVNGVSLAEDEFHLKFYIEKQVACGQGDKLVVQNQLKATISQVFNDVKTEDGEDIDVIFGMTSVSARIVNSPFVAGTLNRIMNKIRDDVIKMRS